MSTDTMKERFFETAFDLAQQAQELHYRFPLVIAFSDQRNRVACILTINDFGKFLPGKDLKWDSSGWVWEWEPGYLTCVYEEPFRAASTSYDGRTQAGTVPFLSLKEEVELMRANEKPN